MARTCGRRHGPGYLRQVVVKASVEQRPVTKRTIKTTCSPAEAAALMRCTESWLRDGATSGRFPHACWGKGKIIFTSEHILEIAKLSEILPGSTGSSLSGRGPVTKERLIGTRSKVRLTAAH